MVVEEKRMSGTFVEDDNLAKSAKRFCKALGNIDKGLAKDLRELLDYLAEKLERYNDV